MFAPRSLATSFSGTGRFAIDVPVAALAGLSVAFLAFAMPGDALADLVGATGLASLIPAAEPPLGLKARIGIGAAGAIAVFSAAFLVLRWLDRLGARSDDIEETVPMQPPRLRRRDFHPDAPPRPPIMAADELGEPENATPVDDGDTEPTPEGQDEWLLDQPAPLEATEPDEEPATFDDPAFDPVPPPAAEWTVPATEFEAPPAAAPTSGNLDELMARLEQGLARRRTAATPPAAAGAPAEPPAPKPFPEAGDDRLQSAIDSLQRLAARGD
jgi:hypothetical protein